MKVSLRSAAEGRVTDVDLITPCRDRANSGILNAAQLRLPKRGCFRFDAMVGCAAFALGLLPPSLHAQSLELDRAFAPRITRPTTVDWAAAQPDGMLLVYGADVAEVQGESVARLVRFTRDGSLDHTFRFDEVITEAANTSLTFAVIPDGKLLSLRNPSNGNQFSSFVRYNADGSRDATFGTVPAPSGEFIAPWTTDNLGRIYATARYPDGVWGLYRIGVDGQVDATFRARFDRTSPAGALLPLPDGRLVATGAFRSVNDIALTGNPGFVRLTATGSIDPSFVYRGADTGLIHPFAPLADGRLIAITTDAGRSVLVRGTDDGAIDPTFALADAATFSIERALALPDGRIAAAIRRISPSAGQTRYALSFFRPDGSLQREHNASLPFALVAVLPDSVTLARDGMGNAVAFAADGGLVFAPFAPLRAIASPEFVLPLRDGGVVMAPAYFQPAASSPRYDSVNGLPRSNLVRLTASGAVDGSFASPAFDNRTRQIRIFGEEESGAILLGVVSGGSGPVLTRISANGRPDDTFNQAAAAAGGIFTAVPIGAEILGVTSGGKFIVLNRDGRLARNLPIEVEATVGLTLQPTAHGQIAVSGSFRTLNRSPVALSYFRLNRDFTLDESFRIAPGENLRPAELVAARTAPLPDGGVIAYRDDTGIPRFVQRFAANGALVPNFSVTPTFGNLLLTFLGRNDGTLLFVEHRFFDYAKRVRLLLNDGMRATATDLPIEFISVDRWMNAADGAVLVSGVSSVAGERRHGLARLIRGTGTSAMSPPRLVNVSAIAPVGTNDAQAIVGFVVTTGPRLVLARGIGPSLATFGLSDALTSTRLQLFAGTNLLASSGTWGGTTILRDAFLVAGAFPLPLESHDSALLTMVPAGPASAICSPGDGVARGTGLLEVYDLGADDARALRNISLRAEAGRGATLTAGFVIRGEAPARILIRAVGPALRDLGVTSALNDPRLWIFNQLNPDAPLAENDNWSDTAGPTSMAAAAAAVGAFPLAARSRDAGLLLSLPAGAYTAQLSSVDGTVGIALIEVYLLDD